MSRAKGRRTVLKAIDYYRDCGWLVDDTELTSRWRKSKDLFSAFCLKCKKTIPDKEIDEHPHDLFPGFDIVGVKKNKMVLVQVKTNSPATQSPYKDFSRLFGGRNLLVHVYTWYDYDGPRIQDYKNTGKIDEIDLRKSKNS